MSRVPIYGLLVSLICAQGLRATNPNDVNFTLQLTRDTRVYHIGESIEFEISYTSQSEQKYQISHVQPIPEFTSVTLRLVPSAGALDLRALKQCVGFGGSYLSGGPQYLSSHPITARADLTSWYRIRNPGHYSLTVTTQDVWRSKNVDEGGGQEYLTLGSNPVEFDVLPPDPAWEAQELGTILHDLENANGTGERYRAQYRLALLDTPESVQKLVGLFLSAPYPEKNTYSYDLTLSSRIDLIITSLEAALSNPEISPLGITESLADLQVRQQLGLPRILSEDTQARAQCEERRKLRGEYLAKNGALLLARVARDSGSLRSEAIYEAWSNAERDAVGTEPAPQALAQLRLAALSVAPNLQPDQQTQLIVLEWAHLPHEQLLPLIRSLADAQRLDAFRLWCEGWPEECSAAILSGARKSDTQMMANVVLLMSEGEHPEVNSELQQRLTTPAMLQDSVASIRSAALVLRAGSRELIGAVDGVLIRSTADRHFNCQVQGYLLGYLFRIAPDDARNRFGEALRNEKCGNQLFRILNTVRYSDEILPVAVEALNSPDLGVAETAALFLGERGPAAVEDLLWQRLDSFWNLWHDKATELRVNLPQRGVQQQSALLEQSLASALSHAKSWALTPAEQGRLRSGCLTEQCQQIADGKMRLGL